MVQTLNLENIHFRKVMLDKETRDLLPAIIRDTMDAMSAMTNAPDEMTLPVTLAVANFATQGLTNVHPHCWDKNVPLSEYFVVLVPSGGMKTSIYDMLALGIKKFERDQEGPAKEALVQYKIDLKTFNKAIDEEVKSPTFVKLVEPIKPKGCRYKVEKATVNGLLNTLEVVPFAGLFSSDAAEFFNSHSFQDSNKSVEMVSTLSKAWSGEDLERNTGIELNNIKLHDRRFNMLVMLQQQLAGFLNNSQYKDQGFVNRMLITQCELFSKPIMEIGSKATLKQNMALLDPFNDRVYDLLDKVNTAQENIRKAPLTLPGVKMSVLEQLRARQHVLDSSNPNELILPLMEFDIDNNIPFEEYIIGYYNGLARRAHDPKYADYSNFMSRAFEHFCRIAATLAAFNLEDKISRKTAECAHGLTEYFIEQRLNLNVDGSVTVSPIVELAKKVHAWLIKRPNMEATKTEVSNGPLKNIDEDVRAKVCQEMESRDMIKVIPVESKGTKPKNIYKAIMK